MRQTTINACNPNIPNVPTISFVSSTPSSASANKPPKPPKPTTAKPKFRQAAWMAPVDWATEAADCSGETSYALPAKLAPLPSLENGNRKPTKSHVGPKKQRSKVNLLGRVGGSVGISSNAKALFRPISNTSPSIVADDDDDEMVIVPRPKFGEITNTITNGAKEKSKAEEKDKWWSIGRGRRDLKELKKNLRSKSPATSAALKPLSRSGSITSGAILNGTPGVQSGAMELPIQNAQSSSNLLMVPGAKESGKDKDSVAIRAIRSVRSLARLTSAWKVDEPPPPLPPKDNKDSKRNKKANGDLAIRASGSSFEAGHLTASPMRPIIDKNRHSDQLSPPRSSFLGIGLGFPGSMRIQTTRQGSSASSVGGGGGGGGGVLQVTSGVHQKIRDGSTSTAASAGSASSLRPVSVASGASGSAGCASVRWDEKGLQKVRERTQREKDERRKANIKVDIKIEIESEQERTRVAETKRSSSESRRRMPLSGLFHELAEAQKPPPIHIIVQEPSVASIPEPIHKIKTITTPEKKPSARPQSDQMLGRARPKVIDDEAGVLSMLDAATNDLERLISHLDLEATPSSAPRKSPPTRAFDSLGAPVLPTQTIPESPLKRHGTTPSLSSLRPYAQSRSPVRLNTFLPGQQIVPWPAVDWPSSPVKPFAPLPTARLAHKRTLTPAPDIEPMPIFTALRPRKPPKMSIVTSAEASPAPSPLPTEVASKSRHTIMTVDAIVTGAGGSISPTPVFTKAPAPPIQPSQNHTLCKAHTQPDSDIPDELHVLLATQANMDSDLLYDGIVKGPSPVPKTARLPPVLPILRLPVFQSAIVESQSSRIDTELSPITSDEDTGKKSFDFTGEINKLNQSGGSGRRSFVQQLDHAFRTPAKIDLRYGFETAKAALQLLPFPASSTHETEEEVSFTVDINASLQAHMSLPVDIEQLEATILPGSDSLAATEVVQDSTQLLKVVDSPLPVDFVNTEPSVLVGSDSIAESCEHFQENVNQLSSVSIASPSPVFARSDGKLDSEFKFGGRPYPAQLAKSADMARPLTLSDVIPPLVAAKALLNGTRAESDSILTSLCAKATEAAAANLLLVKMEPSFIEDDSVINSIYAQVAQFSEANLVPRLRLESDSASKREARAQSLNSLNGRQRGVLDGDFMGFESFAEIRRGFEFNEERPAFYPRSIASRHGRQESIFSIASVSSYGQVIDPGSGDPFNFCLSSRPLRPMSEDLSITVDDTFNFVHPAFRRMRMNSNASSLYFNPAPPTLSRCPYERSYHRRGSSKSSTSIGWPRTTFNRTSHRHRDSFIRNRNDSAPSAGSVANSYAVHGANGGRKAWAKHRSEPSWDSILDSTSMTRGTRPGLGDKMLQSAFNIGVPLTSISASPPESSPSAQSSEYEMRGSYDSIMDGDKASTSEDSLFEQSGQRSSMSSDSVFGYNDKDVPAASSLLPNQFRPLSEFSMVNPSHSLSPRREDDTMISMVGGGGRVRRRSIGSMIDGSPCARVEKRKQEIMEESTSATRAAPIKNPSTVELATFTSENFGGDQILRKEQGLYSCTSLEHGCLVRSGENISLLNSTSPGFSQPGAATRSRSSTCTAASSEADTPPLSAVETSSASGGSQSSIDLSSLNTSLANASFPNTVHDRARARARGHGHRARFSQAHSSRASVYETITEERSSTKSPSPTSQFTKSTAHIETPSAMCIVDADSVSLVSESIWDEDDTFRRFHALRQEAEYTVTDSKRVWIDTAFSLYSCQSFVPPKQRAAMQAMLQHSLENYHSLPPELRRIRSRQISRPSPYKTTSISLRPLLMDAELNTPSQSASAIKPRFLDTELNGLLSHSGALSQLSINPNIKSPEHSYILKKPVLPASLEISDPGSIKFGLSTTRPRVPSTTRRVALGWSKRSNNTNDHKENNMAQSLGTKTPNVKDTLRFSRPRPKGRPMSTSVWSGWP